jgi:hypothetical protein
MNTDTPKGITVYFSYVREDEELRDKLAKHLTILQRQGIITAWYDHEICAGTEQAGEIDRHLNTAHIILLLISVDFLASDYYDTELTRVMEREEAGKACLIPVILRPVHWMDTPLGNFQGLPTNVIPVTSWVNQDEAFLNIAQGIRRLALNL